MNRLLAFSSLILSVFLSSCSISEVPSAEGETLNLTITADGDSASKTCIGPSGAFLWSSGDALKVFETTNGPATFNIYDSEPGATADGSQTMSFSVQLNKRTASSFGYTAFYPKTSLYSAPGSASAVAINIPSLQKPTATSFDKAADVLIAKPVEGLASQPEALSMRFARPVAIGNLTLSGLPAGSKVTTIAFSAVKGGNPVPLAGATTFNLLTAKPAGEYGDAAAEQTLTISCEQVDNALHGDVTPYTIRDFDWNLETVGDPSTTPFLKGRGLFFTCWPFSLAEGDSFKIVVRIGDYTYTKDITIPSGRSFEMPEGGVGSFSVDMSKVSPVYEPDDYLSRWNAGEDIQIGERAYNKATFGAATLVKDGESLPARTGVYIIDTDASVSMAGAYSNTAGNLIIIGRTPGNRPTVTKSSAPLYYNGADNYVALKNINFVANSVPVFNLSAKLSAIDVEDCNIAMGLLYSSAAENTGFQNVCIRNNKIALCKEDVQTGNRDNGVTRGIKSGSMDKFEFCGNVVYPRNNVPSRFGFNQDLTQAVTSNVQEVVFNDNLFVDVAPYGSFANWTNDYKLTMRGNVIDFEGVRTDANSVNQDDSELNYFAQRYNGEPLSDVTEAGNAVFYTNPSRFSMVAVRQPLTQKNRYAVAVPQETVLQSRDFSSGEFPLKRGALYAEVSTTDGTRFWGSVDCTNHKIYINHVPRADMVSSVKIWPESCECSELTGSWPSKTITVDDIQYDVLLPDYVEGTPLSGYTLQWADEFTLDHVDYQAWRHSSSGGGASGYQLPDDKSLASVSDGSLKLWYKTVTDNAVGYWPDGSSLGYVAGGLDTRYHRDFSFNSSARIQVRMKWNEMKGLWQAAWLLADPNQAHGTSRKCVGGELDIIEHLGTTTTMYQTLHTENTVTNDSEPSNCGQTRIAKYTHNDTWFTFDVEVVNAGTASADVKFYINGSASSWYSDFKSYHPKSYWASRETGNGYYWPYDIFDYCMILTAQVGGSWCGEPDGTTAIAAGTKAMTVDYVRYYTKN